MTIGRDIKLQYQLDHVCLSFPWHSLRLRNIFLYLRGLATAELSPTFPVHTLPLSTLNCSLPNSLQYSCTLFQWWFLPDTPFLICSLHKAILIYCHQGPKPFSSTLSFILLTTPHSLLSLKLNLSYMLSLLSPSHLDTAHALIDSL